MKVVILCGGLGTRLREETEFKPKPMVEIGDRPILWHIMKTYAHYGYNDFVLCLGYKGEMIKEYFLNYELLNNDFTIKLGERESFEVHSSHDERGWLVTLADTGDDNLKGSRLKQIEKYIKEDMFLVTYGDGIANLDLNDLVRFHIKHGKTATVTGVNAVSLIGDLKIEGDKVQVFREKHKKTSNFVSGGYFVFNRNIFDKLSINENVDLEIGPLEELAKEGELMVYKHPGFWACMDTYRDVELLNRMWKENRAEWKVW
ncbi:MAG: glucose-1-phosphate cytidylyltransferase [Candidatus Omnitrophota bacterium]